MRELTENEIEAVSGGRWHHHHQAPSMSLLAPAQTYGVNPAITNPYEIAFMKFHGDRVANISPMVA